MKIIKHKQNRQTQDKGMKWCVVPVCFLLAIASLVFAPAPVHADVLLHVDFEDTDLGTYTPSEIAFDWASQPGWTTSKVFKSDDLAIVELDGSKVLQSTNAAGRAGGATGGTFRVNFQETYEDLYMAYRVRFAQDFYFSKGGKMPRFQGGVTLPSCTRLDSFSAAVTWHSFENQDTSRFSIRPYVYHLDRSTLCGQSTSIGEAFSPGKWYFVEVHVKLNSPGAADGLLTISVDGVQTYERTTYRFRDTADLQIERFAFKANFGGPNNESWRAIKDEQTYYDDFVISTTPIGVGGDVDAGVLDAGTTMDAGQETRDGDKDGGRGSVNSSGGCHVSTQGGTSPWTWTWIVTGLLLILRRNMSLKYLNTESLPRQAR